MGSVISSYARIDIEHLRTKASKGAAWSFGGTVCTTAINFIVLAVLARLLEPVSFGIFALALVAIQLFTELGEFGLLPGLIQAKEVNESILSSCFWLSLMISVCIAVAFYAAAPFVGLFFKSSEFGRVAGMLGLALIFDGVATVPFAVLQRAMRFKEIVMVEVVTTIAQGAGTVFLAFYGLGVFSLVLGFILRRSLRCVSMFWVIRYRPLWIFGLKRGRGVLSFGANVTGERIVNFFAQRVDYILIGRFLGTILLGYYSLASEISTIAQKKFSIIISQVAFPAYSMLQDDDKRMATAYLKVVGHVASVTFPLLFCIAALAPKFVLVVYGDKWLPAVPVLRILCVLGCYKSVGTLVGSLIYAKGRADIGLKWSFVMLSGTLIGVVIGKEWGIIGAAVGYSVSFVVLAPLIQTIALNLVNERLVSYFRILLPACFASVIAAGAAWVISEIILGKSLDSELLTLLCAVTIGALVYCIVYYLIGKRNVLELWQIGKVLLRRSSVGI